MRLIVKRCMRNDRSWQLYLCQSNRGSCSSVNCNRAVSWATAFTRGTRTQSRNEERGPSPQSHPSVKQHGGVRDDDDDDHDDDDDNDDRCIIRNGWCTVEEAVHD